MAVDNDKRRPDERDSDEINTLIDPSKSAEDSLREIEALSPRLSVSEELNSVSVQSGPSPTLVEKIFSFPDFPPRARAYCDVKRIVVHLRQTAEGTGIVNLTFTQDCQSVRSRLIDPPDWWFSIELRDAYNSYIRSIYIGQWDHGCGSILVELQGNFYWTPGAINPVANAASSKL